MVYSHHIYPVYLTHAETYCFSVNHAGKDFIRYNRKVNGGKFGMDETKSDGKITRNGEGIFHNSANDRERRGLLIFCCSQIPAHPRPHKHTFTNKKDTVWLMISAHPTSSPHHLLFQFPSRRMHKFSHHTTAQK